MSRYKWMGVSRKLAWTVLAIIFFACGSSNKSKSPPISSGHTLNLQSGLNPGAEKGRYDLTFYWLAEPHADDTGKNNVKLFDKSCNLISKVTPSFSKRLRMEGAGILSDGRVLTATGKCSCSQKCYKEVSQTNAWGTGVQNRPLNPFRSIAVDPRKIDIGETLYLAQLDGQKMQGEAPWGDFVHDGCVLADDVGHGVKGRTIDLFIVSKNIFKSQFKGQNRKPAVIRAGGERCRYLTH